MEGKIRFNHIALTLPYGTLKANRADFENFYSGILGADVFGYGDSDSTLVISFDEGFPSQSIVLNEGADFMVAKGFDHIGLEYQTFSEVDSGIAECRYFRRQDDRIEIGEIINQQDDGYRYRACYVRYLLPMQLDIQAIQWDSGKKPKQWKYDA